MPKPAPHGSRPAPPPSPAPSPASSSAPSPVVITGMHRSGTSYVASWFAAAGVDMGVRLLAADAANPRGYYEDLDFLALHRRMLAAAVPAAEAGYPDWGWDEGERLDESRFGEHETEARSLAARRAAAAGGGLWGWKDPRASLALGFWHQALSAEGLTPCYVLVYRFPWEVADSMQRLGSDVFLRHPEYGLRIWAFYNRRLLAWRRRAGGRTLLVSVNALQAEPARFAALVRERLGPQVAGEPPAGTFEPGLFTGLERGDPLPGLVALTSPAVTALLAELDQAADLPSTGLWDATPPRPRQWQWQTGAAGLRGGARPTPAPRLSVIVPCYNHGEFLVDAVASFERSRPPEAEILIVDDGSTQARTLEVLAALRAAGYEVLDQANSGLAAARNRGIAAARAPYILPLDSDNRLRPGFAPAAIAQLDSDETVGVVYGDRWELGLRSGRVSVPEFDLDRLLAGNYIDACAVFRRSAWEDCGGYALDVPAWEDWELWIAMAERGWRFCRLPVVTFDYRVRPDSMVTACQSPEVGQRLQRRIVTKHRELYLDHLPGLLTLLQHGRTDSADGLVAPVADGIRDLRAELAGMHSELAGLRAELARLEGEHAALAAEGQALRERGRDLEGMLKRLRTAADGFIAERDRLDREIGAWRERVGFMSQTRVWRLRAWILRLRGRKQMLPQGRIAARKEMEIR